MENIKYLDPAQFATPDNYLMEGFVSKVWLLRFLFEEEMAAAAATPTGPEKEGHHFAGDY